MSNVHYQTLLQQQVVASNDSAKEIIAHDKLRELAVVLAQRVREYASIDWTIKENLKAKLKVIIRRTLRQYGYPPDMELLATETVLKQAEMIADELTVNHYHLPVSESGHLLAYKNLRNIRNSTFVNLLEKILVQNPITQKIISYLALRKIDDYVCELKEGNIYFFTDTERSTQIFLSILIIYAPRYCSTLEIHIMIHF